MHKAKFLADNLVPGDVRGIGGGFWRATGGSRGGQGHGNFPCKRAKTPLSGEVRSNLPHSPAVHKDWFVNSQESGGQFRRLDRIRKLPCPGVEAADSRSYRDIWLRPWKAASKLPFASANRRPLALLDTDLPRLGLGLHDLHRLGDEVLEWHGAGIDGLRGASQLRLHVGRDDLKNIHLGFAQLPAQRLGIGMQRGL